VIKEARGELKDFFIELFKKGREEAGNLDFGLEKIDEHEIEYRVKQILAKLKLDGWAVIMDATPEILERVTKDGIYQAMLQVGLSGEELTEKVSKIAVDYARSRGAELVGKRLLPDGTIIDNPNRDWAITDSTRDLLRGDITKAIEEGWSTKKLQDEIEKNYGFSEERAEMIARTETAFADTRGNAIAYKESGLVSAKKWILGSNHPDMDECDMAADAGAVPFAENFPGVDVSEPPAHPHCLCDFIPVLEGEED